jgi:hypothetical protein
MTGALSDCLWLYVDYDGIMRLQEKRLALDWKSVRSAFTSIRCVGEGDWG